MTNIRTGTLGSKRPLNSQGMVLLAETSNVDGTKNTYSGMMNPQMVDGSTSITFSKIPQNFKDLKFVFSDMAHNTNNSNGYRLLMNINGDTTNNRYYTRAGSQVSGGNTSATQWNADNTTAFYWGYVYRPENVTWTGMGELNIPRYSTTLTWNVRQVNGYWYNIQQMSTPFLYAGYYYNNTAAAQPVTSVTFTLEGSVGFRTGSKISLYAIG
jgi:hypothetical protein